MIKLNFNTSTPLPKVTKCALQWHQSREAFGNEVSGIHVRKTQLLHPFNGTGWRGTASAQASNINFNIHGGKCWLSLIHHVFSKRKAGAAHQTQDSWPFRASSSSCFEVSASSLNPGFQRGPPYGGTSHQDALYVQMNPNYLVCLGTGSQGSNAVCWYDQVKWLWSIFFLLYRLGWGRIFFFEELHLNCIQTVVLCDSFGLYPII